MNYILEYFVVPRRWFALSRIPSKCCFMQETKMIIGQKYSKSGQRRISKLCNKINLKIDFVKTTCNLTPCFALHVFVFNCLGFGILDQGKEAGGHMYYEH